MILIKNNTKHVALFTAALLLTTLAQNCVIAAQDDKVPVTVETAQTLSYTVTSYGIDEKSHDLPIATAHVYFSRPDSYRLEYAIVPDGHKSDKLVILNGNAATRYDATQNTYTPFRLNKNTLASFGFPLPPDKLEHVIFEGKPALLYAETTPFNGDVSLTKQTWYDAETHETLLTSVNYSGKNAPPKPGIKIVYSGWKLNAPLNPALFVFTPPPGAKLEAAEPVTR